MRGKRFRVIGIVVLAFIAALIVTLGALQIHLWLAPSSDIPTDAPQTFTEEQKLLVLSSLSATSSSSTKSEKTDVLKGLPAASASTSEQQKLDILEGLKAR